MLLVVHTLAAAVVFTAVLTYSATAALTAASVATDPVSGRGRRR
jgi:hypothetical protein